MRNDTNAKVISNIMIIPEHYKMEIYSPNTAVSAQPGQFIHIKIGGTSSPLLRRPMSIYMRDREKGTISILYKTIGEGTSLLTQYKQNDNIDIIGPLGNGFPLDVEQNRIVLVGGGVGITPLMFLALEAVKQGKHVTFIQGAPSENKLIGIQELINAGCNVKITTDDASSGFHGFPTELLERHLNEKQTDTIYSCGPGAMLKTIKKISLENNVQAYISLEERMGCGVGACLGCVCKVLTGDKRILAYKRVCKDGPVFPAEVVLFDD